MSNWHVVSQDEDALIVDKTLEYASNGKSVSLHANDTDIIVMLLHHWRGDMSQILVKSNYNRRGCKEWKQLDVEKAVTELNPQVKKNILFVHAFGGCDTTSGIHEKGKSSVAKLLAKSKEAQELANIFLQSNMSQDQIGRAGVNVFVLLYGGNSNDTLESIRHRCYMKMAASLNRLNPSKLPPTERAAHFHSL